MTCLYYFANLEKFESIIKRGIYSYNKMINDRIYINDFSNKDVQLRRHNRNIIIGNKNFGNLHNYVPLYYTPKTPTFYNYKDESNNYFFIEVDLKELINSNKTLLFTDGNAASSNTKIFEPTIEAVSKIDWEVIETDYWHEYIDGKRKRNAEVLVYSNIETIYFKTIIVRTNTICENLLNQLEKLNWQNLKDGFKEDIKIGYNPNYFFK